MSDEKKKIVSLRISPKTIEEVREKAGEQSVEYQFIKTLKDSNVPYSILSNILDIPADNLRNCITYRRKYEDESQRERVCVKFKKVLDRAMDEGLLPCSDIAVVEPIIRLTLRVMALGNR
jgi:hypothetical protein|nr:MAG TPA_asm: hypothetical protein [Caudoviricetes sp.]DAP70088.1 MAG TPA: hypothetical protein [Caudoviricetes sp.]